MKYFAVLDTNVIVSALLGKNSIPAKILDEALSGSIIPLFDNAILDEYEDVTAPQEIPFYAQRYQEHDKRSAIARYPCRGRVHQSCPA